MNDRSIRRLASAGLVIGGILGMAGTFAPSSSLRALARADVPPREAFTVLPVERDGPRITPFLAYQTEMAWRQDDERRARFAALGTDEDVRRLQGELRAKVLAMIGGLPATRTPLNVRIDRPRAERRLPRREDPLREPARRVRDGARLRARGRGRPASGGARGLRPFQQRQDALPGALPAPRAARLRRDLLGSDRPGRAQPVLGRVGRPKPLQPDLRRARRARQPRLSRRRQPRSVGSVGRHACARLPADAGRRGSGAHQHHRHERWRHSRLRSSGRSIRASASSRRPATSRRCRCACTTASSRIPTAIPNRTWRGSSRPAWTMPGCCCSHTRGRCSSRLPCSTSFPIEGTWKTVPRDGVHLPARRPRRSDRDGRGLPPAPVLGRQPARRAGVPRPVQPDARRPAAARGQPARRAGAAVHPDRTGDARSAGRALAARRDPRLRACPSGPRARPPIAGTYYGARYPGIRTWSVQPETARRRSAARSSGRPSVRHRAAT